MCRLPLCTPNVNPTMSGVIVERRDQVRITCGRCEPARMRSTVFRIPLSTQGPFLTERGMFHFRLLIADCRFEDRLGLEPIENRQLAIGNHFALRSLTIIFFVRLFRRVLYPRVGWPQGVTGLRPPEVLPSPPPCGWSTGFIATPRTCGLIPFQRDRPAFPSETFSCSTFPTWPTVARPSTVTRRTSPEGIRNCANWPSFARSCANDPAARAICPPLPGRSSML